VAQIAAQFGVTRQRAAGDTIAEIVAKTGITRSSLYRHLPARPADPITAAGTKPTRPMTQPAA
jgi:DNA-binding phage protein